MSNRDLKIQWAIEVIEDLVHGKTAVNCDTFNLWKAKRDEQVREERAAKRPADHLHAALQNVDKTRAAFDRAKAAYEKQKAALNPGFVRQEVGNTGDGKTMNAAPSLTYVVHGYESVENGSILHAPVPRVSLLYAGGDGDHAREIAIGCSRQQVRLSVGLKLYDRTTVSVCHDGKPSAIENY